MSFFYIVIIYKTILLHKSKHLNPVSKDCVHFWQNKEDAHGKLKKKFCMSFMKILPFQLCSARLLSFLFWQVFMIVLLYLD